MKRSTTVACCVCLPFRPAAWSMEMGGWGCILHDQGEMGGMGAHTGEWHDGVHTAECAKKVPTQGNNPPYLKTQICAVCYLLFLDFLYSWKYLREYLKHKPDLWVKSTTFPATAITIKWTESKHCNNYQKFTPQFPLFKVLRLSRGLHRFRSPLTSPFRVRLRGSSRFFSLRSCYLSGTTTDSVMMFCACFTEGMSIMLPRKVKAPCAGLQQMREQREKR